MKKQTPLKTQEKRYASGVKSHTRKVIVTPPACRDAIRAIRENEDDQSTNMDKEGHTDTR